MPDGRSRTCHHQRQTGHRCLECGRRIARTANPASVLPSIESDLPYAVESLIGEGGMARVYRARLASGEPIALKVAKRESSGAAFAAEAAKMKKVGPPAAPRVFDVDSDRELATIAMELIDLPTLAARMASEPSDLDFVASSRSILAAVEACHAAGVVHLDIKPENLVITPAHTTLLDFGLSRDLDSLRGAEASFLARGTPEYMAPELERGLVCRGADIYALGVVLFELLTGAAPFFGLGPAVRRMHQAWRAPRPSHRGAPDDRYDRLIERCLAKTESDRFETATDILAAIERARPTRRSAVASPPPNPPPATTSGLPALPLIAIASDAPLAAIAALAERCGGALAHTTRAAQIVVFDRDPDGGPKRLLAELDEPTAVVVDLAPVLVRRSSRGGVRAASPAFVPLAGLVAEVGAAAGILATGRGRSVLRASDFEIVAVDLYRDVTGRAGDGEKPTMSSEPRLIGRDGTLDDLDAGLREGRSLSLLGEAGIGKSRLARALAERLSQRGRRVIAPSTDAVGTPAFPIRLLAAALGTTPSALDRDSVAALGSQGELWLGVAANLEDGLANLDDDQREELSRLARIPMSLHFQLVHAVKLAVGTDSIVIVDDAHREDEACFELVETLTASGVQTIVIARPELGAARPSLVASAETRLVVSLGPLAAAAADELVRALLRPATNIADPIVAAITARSSGNPLVLHALSRALWRAGAVRKNPRGDSWQVVGDVSSALDPLRATARRLHRELDLLSPELRAHAELLAVIGEGASIDEIVEITRELDEPGRNEAIPLDAVVATSELVGSGFIAFENGRLRFASALDQGELSSRMSGEAKRTIAAAALAHFQRVDQTWRSLGEISRHAQACGLAEIAANAAQTLAELAQNRHAYLAAERFYTRAIELRPEAEATARLATYRGRGSVRYRIGRYTESVADLAVARLAAAGLALIEVEASTLLDQAEAYDWMDKLEESQACTAAAAILAATAETPLLRARLDLARGRTEFRNRDWAAAAAALESSVAAAQEAGIDADETATIARLLLAPVYASAGKLAAASSTFESVIADCEERGDRLHLAAALNNRTGLRGMQSDLEGAIDDGRRCLAIGRELGLLSFEASINLNLGELLCLAGDFEGAQRYVDRAIESERRRSPRRTAAVLGVRLLLHRGELTRARDARDALLAQALTSSEALQPQDHLMLEMVDCATRDASQDEWDRVCERFSTHGVEQEPIEVWLIRSESAHRRGDVESARRYLARAKAESSKMPGVMAARIERRLRGVGS